MSKNMSCSSEGGNSSVSVKRRYRGWKRNSNAPIPLKTMQRWNKKLKDDCHESFNVDEISIPSCHQPIDLSDDHNVSISSSLATSDDEDINSSSESIDEYTHDNDPNQNDHTIHQLGTDGNVFVCDFDNEIDEDPNDEENLVERLENNQMSTDEIVLDLLDLFIRHKCTKECLKSMLSIILKILPQDTDVPKSVYKLFQYVEDRTHSFTIIRHFYCQQCMEYNSDIESVNAHCQFCNATADNLSYFFEIDIEEQLQFMFEKRDLYNKIIPFRNAEANVISDLIDGSEYIRVNSRPDRKKYDLTLVLNTDGISLMNSSSSHCWPLIFVIAELPEHLRELYMVTMGIWYDVACKPSMNVFLKPFCKKLIKCFENGISWKHPQSGEIIITKVIAPLVIADAPARAQLQNIMNFNGRYGCNICEVKMKKSPRIGGQRRYRAYYYDEKGHKLRSSSRIRKQIEKLSACNKHHVKGVKGSSILTTLPFIDLGTCFVPEYMHSVLLGVVKQFIDLWFTKKGKWSIKKYTKDIDNYLTNIKPPYFFNRMPRSISQAKHFKASEFYNWLLFYSLPALRSFLPEKYLNHWIILVRSLFILLEDSIQKSNLEIVHSYLQSFVKDINILYTDRQLTYNVHQLLHLTLCVKRWGPLWATSAFGFENYNGILAHSIHGTKHIGEEIMKNLNLSNGINILKCQTPKSNAEVVNDKVNEMMGKNINIHLNDLEKNILTSNIEDNLETVTFYSRAKINGETYTSEVYKQTKTNSYTVKIILVDGEVLYGPIKYFFKLKRDPSLNCLLLNLFSVQYGKMFFNRTEGIVIDHIKPVEKSEELRMLKLNEINSIYHLIAVNDYVCVRPNMKRKNY